jgi:(p)ppGpp synthase/HD superfamily hydrolase
MYNKKRLRPNNRRSVSTNAGMVSVSVMALLLSLSSSDAFSKVATQKRSSVLSFRSVGMEEIGNRQLVSSPWVGSQTQTVNTVTAAAQPDLPTWLAVPRSHLSETNLQRLQKAMLESYFTDNEALKVMFAIEEAASGDAQLVAGASDFLLLILETVEMGVNALVAAAFHYCSSFTARRQSSEHLTHHANVASFGAGVETLVHDIGRLKELELRATRVMQNSEAARPDQKDADNLRMLLLSETADWRALTIRTVASLYRLRGILSAAEDPNRVPLTPEAVRTSREALSIYAPLASRLGMNRLKNELESGAFKILYQRQHGKVNSSVHQFRKPLDALTIGQSMDELMKQVKDEMTEMFENDAEFIHHVEHFALTARVKQPYSVWKKMLSNGHDHILQVPDALAFRIVLQAKTVDGEPTDVARARERALCYYAQKRCTQRWQPLMDDGRFKDYIERPKANGYQSLHYTAMAEYAGENWSMEIQVRSKEMHSVAEYGLASHWDYKADEKANKSATLEVKIEDDIDRSSQAYLRKVQQWHWQQVGAQPEPSFRIIEEGQHGNHMRADHVRQHSEQLEPYLRALTAARSDLARDFVFVFMKEDAAADARVLALPAGACVVDALREGEKSLGMSMWNSNSSYDLNGAATTVSSRLSNGDVLTL